MMAPGEFYKKHGAKSIQQVSDRFGVPVNTLRDWMETRNYVAIALAERCKLEDSTEAPNQIEVAVSEVKESVERLQSILK